jgi:hypothetical protein
MARHFEILRGVVAPANPDDWARGMVITTDDDEEYLIDAYYGKGEQIVDFIDQYLEVGGYLRDEGGDVTLLVKRFRKLEGSDLEEGDEYDDDADYDDD